MAVSLNTEVCIGCGCCSDVCAVGALELETKAVLNEGDCTTCLSCIEMCPVAAITE
jgi:ferredoxin